MTLGGWVIMTLSVGGMTGLLAWCIARVLSKPTVAKKLHSQADIDTGDQE